jgi:hypothetical protein
MPDDTRTLLNRLVGGDRDVTGEIVARSGTDGVPALLVAIADAHLRGDADPLDAQDQPEETDMSTVQPVPQRRIEHRIEHRTDRRVAALLMVSAALLAIAGFTALGSVFEYPQILKTSTAHILDGFRAHQGAVMTWFAVLVLGAGLMAPIGILLGRVAGGRAGRWIAATGVAAAAVQAVGLSRWLLLVPGTSVDALDPARTASAEHRFELAHLWLGTVLGETIGYALTAAFTVLVSATVVRAVAARWLAVLGYACAALVATGVVVPLGVHAATLTNFAGYVGWCLWLIAVAAMLWRERTPSPAGLDRGTPVGGLG